VSCHSRNLACELALLALGHDIIPCSFSSKPTMRLRVFQPQPGHAGQIVFNTTRLK